MKTNHCKYLIIYRESPNKQSRVYIIMDLSNYLIR
jgi:hypothetical protein